MSFSGYSSRHETIRCPSKTIEVGVALFFSLVDLSRRRAVLLRGGPRRKGSGGIITYTFSSFPPPFLWHFGASSVLSSMHSVLVADTGLAVVLLLEAVVPDLGAVVPQVPTVVPLLRSCSTVAPRPSAAALR